MNFLHTFQPSSVIFQIGGLAIYYYGLIIVLAMIVGFFVARYFFKKQKLTDEQVVDLAWWLIVAGIVGARIYYVVYAWPYYRDDLWSIFFIWRGGLAIHGAIIAGLIVVWYFAKHYKISAKIITDSLALALPLSQAVGRWGNYFNQELFGRPSDQPWAIPIDLANRPPQFINHQYFQPTFLYESILNLFLFFLLLCLYKYGRLKDGHLTAYYLLGYGLIRSWMEFYRTDYSPLIGGVRWALLFSLSLIILSSAWLIFQKTKTPQLGD